MLWSTLDTTAYQNKDLKCYLIILYQFILTFYEHRTSCHEPNEIDPEPEKVHSIAESLLSLSNLQAHLMSLGEDTDAFDSLKKLERIFIKKSIEESQSKQTNITKFFPVNQLTLK